jgi:2-oxoglutarate dehydrogenase E1 component
MEKSFWATLQDRLNLVKEKSVKYEYQKPEKAWQKLQLTTDVKDAATSPETGISKAKLDKIFKHLMTYPEGLNPLSKVERLQKGKKKLLDAKQTDWALAELAAYSSILMEGKDVRMSGQDVKRGTFSHRHAVFNDAKTFKEYNRLDGIAPKQGKFRIFNSLLSEFGVLGFEYGYSLAHPDNLVLWEAQFGDFYNGAQSMVDQFVTTGESKWLRNSGLVMLLPHGNEGQGPEHSSARVERFLQLCADFNMTVANITTPANFFHALRRQLKRKYRKPLVVMSPKSLLRHPKCISAFEEYATKMKFQEVIADSEVSSRKATRHLLCTGKVYYDLLQHREANPAKFGKVAITRIEQLYPFPEAQVNKLLKSYKVPTFWVQEEAQNMGAWQYLLRYWRKTDIDVISRDIAASPATGFKKIHDAQQADLIKRAFGKG